MSLEKLEARDGADRDRLVAETLRLAAQVLELANSSGQRTRSVLIGFSLGCSFGAFVVGLLAVVVHG